MEGIETAKFLTLSGLIAFVAGGGLLLLPSDAPYLRGGLLGAVAFVLVAYVVAMRPSVTWQRHALVFMASGLVILALGAILSA